MIVCSFSGPVADLPKRQRNAENVIAVLRKYPMVSAFDMIEKAWLRDIIGMLEVKGTLKADIDYAGYPWIKYEVTT